MRILAIDTSGRSGTLAILESAANEVDVVEQAELPIGQRTAQSFAPELKRLLSTANWPATAVELVAVTTGPGSFTGLRIGVTIAKALTYAGAAEIVGVNTLDVLAAQAPRQNGHLWTILDAHRDELFVAKFGISPNGGCQPIEQPHLAKRLDWLAALEDGEFVTGPVLSRIGDQLPECVEVVDQEFWHPQAKTVGMLGWQRFSAGYKDSVWQLVPDYYRLSAAEEKANSIS